jgi:hypothetical protein
MQVKTLGGIGEGSVEFLVFLQSPDLLGEPRDLGRLLRKNREIM